MQLPTSKATPLIIKEREKEQVYKFLMGLNDSMYGTVRSLIIQEEPLPKVKNVLAMIYKEEQHHQLTRVAMTEENGAHVSSTVFASIYKTTATASSQRLVCGPCSKLAHNMIACYQLIGFPEWQREKPKKGNAGCNRVVAKQMTSWASAGFDLEARNRNTTEINYFQTPLVAANSSTGDIPRLRAYQWSSLINLLKNHTNSEILSGKIKDTWILDLGCF